MKLTILHLIPTLKGGGAERQLSMLAVEQARRGATIHVGSRRGGIYSTRLGAEGVNLHVLGDHRGMSPRLLANIHSLIRAVTPDVVQTWLPQMDVLGGIACLWRAKPWILTERASELAFSRRSAQVQLRRLLGQRASAIVANSTAGADYWRRASRSGRVNIVRNAVDVAAIRDAPPCDGQFANTAKKLVLVVGRLHRQKAVEIVLLALSKVGETPEFRVLILGEGPERPLLESMVRDLGLERRVVMLPYLSDWWGLLRGASVLVSVSRYEGHPNVVLEAMAAGCPLVVSDIPEHREFLDAGSAVLVPPEDPLALGDAIGAVLRDARSARQRAEIAATRLPELTIEAATNAYEQVYRRVLHGQCG